VHFPAENAGILSLGKRHSPFTLPFSQLTLNKQNFDPFDSEAINEVLNPQGYVYSGGYGMYQKPYFFLGKLEKKEVCNGITHLVSSE